MLLGDIYTRPILLIRSRLCLSHAQLRSRHKNAIFQFTRNFMIGHASYQIKRIDLLDARVTKVEKAVSKIGRGMRDLLWFFGVGREHFNDGLDEEQPQAKAKMKGDDDAQIPDDGAQQFLFGGGYIDLGFMLLVLYVNPKVWFVFMSDAISFIFLESLCKILKNQRQVDSRGFLVNFFSFSFFV